MSIRRRVTLFGLFVLVLAGCASVEPVQAPVSEPEAAAQAADIQHWQTENGARVYFVEARDLPMVDARVVFDAGAARDGERPGLASLTAALLDKGAGNWDADAVAAALESRGARLSVGSARDMAWVSLRSLSDPARLEPTLEVMKQVLVAPRFDAADFDRERQRLLVALKNQDQKPGSIAEIAFYRTLYGQHPYASPELGTEESLKAMGPEDVVAFHRRHFVARNAVVALVGDLSRPEAERLAQEMTGALPAGEPAPDLPAVPALAEAETRQIEHPSSQSHLWVGAPGMRRGDPDYFPLYVGNHVLGGSGLVSRISEEIREKRGLSYSAYSYFLPMAQLGPFIMGLQTRNDQVEQALAVLRETLVDFRAQGPEANELEAAKKNITGGFPLRIDSNAKIVEYIAMIGFYQLPLDYLDRFNSRVEAVTAEQIREAFQRRLDPERMVTIIVGG
jgi:zinc protease